MTKNMHLTGSTQFYTNTDLYHLEQEKIFSNSWLMLCHESELPQKGQYLTFNIAGEPIVVIRAPSGDLKAFFNICIHRGFPVFGKSSGHMGDHVRCGYHGWRYDRDGKVIGDPGSNQTGHQLKTVNLKIEFGFIFVHLKTPAKAAMSLFEDWQGELNNYHLEKLEPVRLDVFEKVLDINWKFFIENTLEGHHVPSVHPGLDDLIGADYELHFRKNISKTIAPLKGTPQRFWSEKMYSAMLKRFPITNTAEPRKWLFYFIFPHTQISIYPEQIFHLQAIPIDVNKTLIRGRYFHWPESSRISKVAEYLNLRIGRKVYREDLAILKKISSSFGSKQFDQLSLVDEKDRVIQHFHECHERALQV